MRAFLLIAICFCLFSCENEASVAAKPDQLIPQDTMIMVLKRISLIEAHMMNSTFPLAAVHAVLKKSCEKVLTDFHLNPERFERSMDYYATHQDEMTAIYTAILDSLTKESSNYGNISTPSIQDGLDSSIPANAEPPQGIQQDPRVEANPKPGLIRKRFGLKRRRKKGV